MIAVKGLAETIARLQRLDLRAAGREALEYAAQHLESKVQETLSHLPGEDHSAPWLRTGALRASITHQADNQTAVIGSTDPVAVYQELGTRTIPPRPFLAPTAGTEAEAVVQEVARVIIRRLDDGAPERASTSDQSSFEEPAPLQSGRSAKGVADPTSGVLRSFPKAGVQLAASTRNPNFAAKMLGYDMNTFGDMIHRFKDFHLLSPSDHLTYHDNGDVSLGDQDIGNIHEFAP